MKIVIAVILGIITAIGIGVWATGNGPSPQKPGPVKPEAAVSQNASQPAHDHSGLEDYGVKGRVPAYYATTPDVRALGPTLSPELFTGNTRLAYQAAKEIPQVLAQLPCYCHCDRGHGHKSLHSCFESEHGENCGICINEALMAYNLQKHGLGVSEIRKRIIDAYGQ